VAREQALVERARAAVEAPRASLDLVLAREDLQEGDPPHQGPEVGQAAVEDVRGQVVDHAGAHDEVEGAPEAERVEVLERSRPEVAAPPEPPYRVFAGVHAQVPDARTDGPDEAAPVALPAAHVEDRADRPAQQVLAHGHGHAHRPGALGAGMHAMARVAVPLVEIRAIVDVHQR
jgi:hypothetical protein